MKNKSKKQPNRDTGATVFGDIMAAFAERFDQVEAVVFFDASGETIDYHSFLDLFVTRLAAAHHGLIFQSVFARLAWLEMGSVDRIEIGATGMDTVTLLVGEDLYLTVVASCGTIDSDLHDAIDETVLALRQEAGLD